jgi:phosphatidylglycerophosphate synthase
MAVEEYQVSEENRRPLASRSWRVSGAISRWLVRRGVSANAISVLGMVAGVLAGVAFAMTGQVGVPAVAWLVGAVLVQARLTANLLDGMVAVESKRASAVGELYNEVPDRVSDAATLIGLGHAAGGIPWVGDLAAVLAVVVAYVRSAARNAGAPQDYSGPMAKQHRMFVVTVTAVVSAVMPDAWTGAILGDRVGWAAVGLGIIVVGCAITVVRRLARAGRYLTRQGVAPGGTKP